MANSNETQVQQVEHVELRLHRGETVQQAEARVLIESDLNTATTLQWVRTKHLPAQITPLMDELARHAEAVKAGKQKGEGMLANQAAVLDALFNALTRRAMANANEGHTAAADTLLRLALKAQAQCRSSWEAISEIQNPRTVAFVNADQANIAAGGQQQVNNARVENTITPNGLNEAAHGRKVDAGSQTPAIGVDPGMATLGALDGSTIRRGKSALVPEPIPGRRAAAAAKTRKASKG